MSDRKKLNQPTLPKCHDCGTSSGVHVVTREGMIPGAALSYEHLCGACEYRRAHPDAVRLVPPVRSGKPSQAETIF